MKRMVWSSIAVMMVAAAIAIPMFAQPPQGGGGRGPGRGGFGGPGGGIPLLRELNLTDAQRTQIRALTEQRRTQGDDPRRKTMDLQRQLELAIFADAPEPQKIDDLRKSVAAATAEELAARIELQSRVAELLTPEQRAQAREKLGNSTPRRPGRGGGRAGAKI